MESINFGSHSSTPEKIGPVAEGKRFGIRAVAYIIDTIILFITIRIVGLFSGIILVLFSFLVRSVTQQTLSPDEEGINRTIGFIIGLTIPLVYFVAFEWLYGGSLGKIVLSMRVVMKHGQPTTLRAAIVRGVWRYLDGLFFGFVAYRHMKSPYWQRYGDDMGRTIVVSAKSPIIQNRPVWWWFFVAGLVYFVVGGMIIFLISLTGLQFSG